MKKQQDKVPRTKKALVLKPETIRVLHLEEAAVKNLQRLSDQDCPHPNIKKD